MQCEIGCEIERIETFIRQIYWSAGVKGVVIGISGGVDSAVAAALCSRAIGGERMLGLSLPSSVSSYKDLEHAVSLCSQYGIEHRTVGIGAMLDAFRTMPGYEETAFLCGNLMARTRMAILYYYANLRNSLVSGTSNRTEYALGYCTKHGDNAADFQPILHLYKTEVFRLAEELGLPEEIVKKVPSAGLWHGQTDEDELGFTYPVIDASLQALENNRWIARDETEAAILRRVTESLHKRTGAPSLLRTMPGIP